VIKQIFVGAPADVEDQLAFERRLYCVRKRAAWGVRRAGLNDNNENFYACSLSSKTLIYKGQLMAPQLETYYLDLKNPKMTRLWRWRILDTVPTLFLPGAVPSHFAISRTMAKSIPSEGIKTGWMHGNRCLSRPYLKRST